MDTRLQDITAKTAGVNLRDTVRVLRALVIILALDEQDDLATTLSELLAESARLALAPAPLHSKPGQREIDACNEMFERLLELPQARQILAEIRSLETDPYIGMAPRRMPT